MIRNWSCRSVTWLTNASFQPLQFTLQKGYPVFIYSLKVFGKYFMRTGHDIWWLPESKAIWLSYKMASLRAVPAIRTLYPQREITVLPQLPKPAEVECFLLQNGNALCCYRGFLCLLVESLNASWWMLQRTRSSSVV